jgi:hypothetical protein
MTERMAEPEDRSPDLPGLGATRRRIRPNPWSASRTYWILLILFVELQIADILTTNHALALPGVWELNPLMAMSQAKLGDAWWRGYRNLRSWPIYASRLPSCAAAGRLFSPCRFPASLCSATSVIFEDRRQGPSPTKSATAWHEGSLNRSRAADGRSFAGRRHIPGSFQRGRLPRCTCAAAETRFAPPEQRRSTARRTASKCR